MTYNLEFTTRASAPNPYLSHDTLSDRGPNVPISELPHPPSRVQLSIVPSSYMPTFRPIAPILSLPSLRSPRLTHLLIIQFHNGPPIPLTTTHRVHTSRHTSDPNGPHRAAPTTAPVPSCSTPTPDTPVATAEGHTSTLCIAEIVVTSTAPPTAGNTVRHTASPLTSHNSNIMHPFLPSNRRHGALFLCPRSPTLPSLPSY